MCIKSSVCYRESCLGENKRPLQWSFKQAQLGIQAFISLRERKRDTQRQNILGFRMHIKELDVHG